MSLARPLQWRYGHLADSSTATGLGANQWTHLPYKNLIDVLEGETVIRTRLQAWLSFGVQSLVPSGPQNITLWYQDMNVQMGLYASPSLAGTGVPNAVSTDTSDGNWIQQELMSVHQVVYFNNPGFNTISEVIFKIDTGLSESFGKRGPYTVPSGGLFLVWNFASTDLFWQLNDLDYYGYMGGVAKVSALIETAP